MNRTQHATIVAALLAATAAFAGCVGDESPGATEETPASTGNPGPGNDGTITLRILGEAPTFTAGTRGGLPVEVRNAGDSDVTVALSIPGLDAVTADPVQVDVPAGGSTAAVVEFDVAEDAPEGAAPVAVEAVPVDGTGDMIQGTVQTAVHARGDPVTQGESLLITYAAFLEDGRMFSTNDPDFDAAPFPRLEEGYESSEEPLLLTGMEPGLLGGIRERLLDAREGETRTARLPPGEAFGEKVARHEEARRETLERVEEVPTQEQREPYGSFAEYVNGTGQGNAGDFRVNDTFTRQAGENVLRFRLVEVTEEEVAYILAPEVGDRFTLLPAWPEGSEVTEVGDHFFRLYTTPTTQPGEPFTYHAHWPEASAVERMDDDVIVVEHTPEEGLTYQAAGFGAPPEERQVLSVEEDVILVEAENPHPFAGETLIFHTRVLGIMDAEETQAWQQEQMERQQQQP